MNKLLGYDTTAERNSAIIKYWLDHERPPMPKLAKTFPELSPERLAFIVKAGGHNIARKSITGEQRDMHLPNRGKIRVDNQGKLYQSASTSKMVEIDRKLRKIEEDRLMRDLAFW